MSKILPWTIDANDIDHDFDSANFERILVKTAEINKFLNKNYDTNKFFVIGPKGIGKTLLLKLKSKACRDNSYACIPKSILCEKLTNLSLNLSAADLNRFKDKAIWEKIWEMAIYILIHRRFDIELPKVIVDVIGEHTSDLWSILYCLLQNRKNVDDLYIQVALWLRPKVLNLQTLKKVGQVAIFIDNIDEAFDEHVGNNLKNSYSGSAILDPQVWINAQISVLTVARSICQANPHVKIFLAIRSEAFNNYNASLNLQVTDNCIFLDYTKDQVKDIFFKNIQDMAKEDLCLPNTNDPLRRFTGITEITNRFVTNANGEKITENLFDFIYRHTFGRPREIVEMGKRIGEIAVKDRTEEAIYQEVNKVSKRLFDQLKMEIIPFFKDEIFREFCQKIEKNIFNLQKAREVFTEIRDDLKFDNVNSYLYRLGILGVSKVQDPVFIQTFLPVAKYSLNDKTEIPEFLYFFLHPATYSEMKSIHMSLSNFCDPHNIVGYDLVYNPPEEKEVKKHLQLGLDRDALSVIIPEIYPAKQLSIFLKPNHEWSSLMESNEVSFRYGSKSYRFLIYRDDLTDKEKQAIYKSWRENNSPTLFYSSDMRLFEKIVHDTEAITFCNAGYAADLVNIEYNGHGSKQIYLCKRLPPSNFNKIKAKLQEKNPKLKVDLVLVDRFLYRYTPVVTENELVVHVSAEDHSLMICMHRHKYSLNQTSTVRRPATPLEFKFLGAKQLYFVEGLYQLYKILKQQAKAKEIEDHRAIFMAFIYLQGIRLIKKFGNEPIFDVLEVSNKKELEHSLQYFGLETLARMEKYFKIFPTVNKVSDIKQIKQGCFPNNNDFYEILPAYSDYNVHISEVRRLHELLEIAPRENLSTIFISYSFRDAGFVRLLADKLISKGVKTFLFEYDNPIGKLNKIMADKVMEHDKILFVASTNSIKSKACQFELSQCQSKYEASWKDIIIPVRIDDEVLNITKDGIPPGNREEYWKNIEYLRTNYISDFKGYVRDPHQVKFDDEVNQIVRDCIKS